MRIISLFTWALLTNFHSAKTITTIYYHNIHKKNNSNRDAFYFTLLKEPFSLTTKQAVRKTMAQRGHVPNACCSRIDGILTSFGTEYKQKYTFQVQWRHFTSKCWYFCGKITLIYLKFCHFINIKWWKIYCFYVNWVEMSSYYLIELFGVEVICEHM